MMQRAAWLKRLGGRCLDLLVPRVCASCSTSVLPATGDLCETCAWDLSGLVCGAYCRTCGEDRHPYLLIDGRCTGCRLGRQTLRFDAFVRAGHYQGSLRQLILRFKREFVLDRLLGGLLADALQGRLDPGTFDYWVPIPSHWRRRWARGFQPTLLLARAAARRWGGRVEPLLSMARYVRPFHRGMSAAMRADAIAGAFRIGSRVNVSQCRICVIDDVTTTGATLAEARRALRRAGARWIAAAVLAKVSHE